MLLYTKTLEERDRENSIAKRDMMEGAKFFKKTKQKEHKCSLWFAWTAVTSILLPEE